MEEQEKYIRALIELHRGLERQGPGDEEMNFFEEYEEFYGYSFYIMNAV